MAFNVTVPFTVVADSGIQESWDAESGATATVKFKCLWDDHYTLVRQLTGTARYIVAGGGSGASITAFFPASYPGSPNLWCRAIESIVPFGRPKMLSWLPKNTWLAREYAIVTARFGYFPFIGTPDDPENTSQPDASGRPYTSTSIQLSAEIVTVPDYSIRFQDGTPNNTPFPIIVPSAQITMRRFMMPYLPVAEMLSILGSVNAGPITLGNFDCDPGTILFCGGNTEISLDTAGNVNQTCDYTFQYRRYPWNYAIHPKKVTWQPVTNASGDSPYPTGDFSILP